MTRNKASEGITAFNSRNVLLKNFHVFLFFPFQTDKASPDEVEEFLSEIAMMKRIGRHPNVVTMLGCCTLKQPYCMLMEYVPCGDLLQYLRQLRVEYERYTGRALAVSSTMQRPIPRYVQLQLPST
jgi:serine/threonine protein kinase